MEGLLLVRYGEIALKGNNRPFFEKKLVQGIKNNLDGLEYSVERQHGRIFVKFNMIDKEEILKGLQTPLVWFLFHRVLLLN